MADDTYYRSNNKKYCVRKYNDGTCKVWNSSNKLIGQVRTLAAAFEVIKADSSGSDIREV